jgi:ribosomal protein S27E
MSARILLLIPILLAPVAAWAQPLPSGQIEHPAVLHMVNDRRLDVSEERTAELARQAMAMSDEQIAEFILPEHGFIPNLTCTECGNQTTSYSLDRPHQIDCPECGAVMTADTLPTDMEATGQNLLGETVTYELTRVQPGPVGIAATIRYRRHHEMAAAARALGETYHATGDEALARRAIQIMDRFAEVYPHWPVFRREGKPYWREWLIGPPRPYNDWLYGRWGELFMYEIPQDLVFAYDLTYHSPAWEELAPEGVDLRRRIEETLFRPALEHALTAHEDNAGHIWNLNPTMYERMIHLGRVLNDPDVVHQAVHFMQDMVRMSYHFDGMEYEGTITYHGVVTWRLAIAVRMLAGYEDPPGYVDERFGIALRGGEQPIAMPIYDRAGAVTSLMTFPNGSRVAVHDTSWYAGDIARPPTPPDVVPPNIELNAYGHYALGGGIGADGMQAHLHFCPRVEGGHFHNDRLQLILWGAGEELLPDVGYVSLGKPHRYFINRELAHNTVEVFFDEPPAKPEIVQPEEVPTDPVGRFRALAEAERPVTFARSQLIAYDPGTVSGGQVKLVAATSPGPEWMGMERQERHLLMVRVDEKRSYLVDVFRVAGGDRHRFSLRGSADEDVTTDCALRLEPQPGTLAGPDIPYDQATQGVEPYAWAVHDLRRAETAEPWELTWIGEDSGSSVRMFVAPQEGTEVTLGMAPTVRRAMQDARKADLYQGPHLYIERDGPESLYAVVYDCWTAEAAPVVRSVAWEPLGEGADGALALRVSLDGREDVIYCSLDGDEREVAGLRFSGPWAVASLRDGEPQWAWAYDGSVAGAGISVRAPERLELPLVGATRVEEGAAADALIVAGTIPDAENLPGQWVLARLGDDPAYGYGVAAVRAEGDRTVLEVTNDHGLKIGEDTWELLYNPFFRGEGPCRVQISRSAFAQAGR